MFIRSIRQLAIAALAAVVIAGSFQTASAQAPANTYRSVGQAGEWGYVHYRATGTWRYESLAGKPVIRDGRTNKPIQKAECKNMVYQCPPAGKVVYRYLDRVVEKQVPITCVRTDTKIVVVEVDKYIDRPVIVEVDKLVPVEQLRLVMLHQPQTSQIAALAAPTVVSPVLSGIPGIAFGNRFEQRISGGGASIAGSGNSMNNNEAYGAAAAAAAAAASSSSTSTSPNAAAGAGNGSSGSGSSGASGR